MPNPPKGPAHPFWKGGKKLQNGYTLIKKPEHPSANIDGYVMEHRLVMEKHLGRYLKKAEHIHHLNCQRSDNRIENLVVIDHTRHTQHHCGRPAVDYEPLNDSAWLVEQHIQQGKPANEIAREIGCSFGAVKRSLDRHNIKLIDRRSESRFPELVNKAWLTDALRLCSTREIARLLDCTQGCVRHHQMKLGIEAFRKPNGK